MALFLTCFVFIFFPTFSLVMIFSCFCFEYAPKQCWIWQFRSYTSVPLLVGHSPPQMHLFWPIRISGSFWVFGNRIVVDSSTIWKKVTKKQVLFCRKCRDFGAGWTLLSESLWLLFQVVSMCDKLMRDKLTNTKNEFWWLLWILGLVPGKPLNLKQRAAGTQMHEQLKLPQLYLLVYYLYSRLFCELWQASPSHVLYEYLSISGVRKTRETMSSVFFLFKWMFLENKLNFLFCVLQKLLPLLYEASFC